MPVELGLAATCWWTLARTILLCLVAWPMITRIERWFRELADLQRPVAFCMLIAPFLFPELLVGYSYRPWAMSSPQRAEWLCSLLLFFRIVPIGVVTLFASPVALISRHAIHCRWLLLSSNRWSFSNWSHLAGCYWHGPVRRALPALGLMGLVAFQEFELAALLQTPSWTDWFITAQRFGLDRGEMLMKTVWPLLMELPLLAGAGLCLTPRGVSQTAETDSTSKSGSRVNLFLVKAYLGLALFAGCLIPFGIMGWSLPGGLLQLIRQPLQSIGLAREIIIASMFSLCAGMTSWFVAVVWSNLTQGRRRWNLLMYCLLIPGLFGSLLLSLAAVGLFQQTWLRPFYDTPIPWLLVLIVWLLPRAVLLRLWLNALTHTEQVHLAEMLLKPEIHSHDQRPTLDRPDLSTRSVGGRQSVRATELLFRLRDQPRILGMGLLCYWAYLDLSTGYLLAPSGMTSGLVRLYNFMHFGRFAALSAESFVFFGTPLLVLYGVVRLLRTRSRI